MGAAERRLEPERAAAPGCALGADRAAHQLDELARDREAEAGAAVSARRRDVGLRERLEHPLERLGLDADAGVGDLDAQYGLSRSVARVALTCTATAAGWR